jgi:hypothetical protein
VKCSQDSILGTLYHNVSFVADHIHVVYLYLHDASAEATVENRESE